MNLEQKTRIYRKIAIVMAGVILFDTIRPTMVFALTSGPVQPEFSSFEPVATTNMVNEFSGDFTYNLPVLNIPGANGGGYALSLSYHSGASPEEEASWVGYGWTLNPGAIIRNKRGFPDDYKGSTVNYWSKVNKNWTLSVGGVLGLEFFSVDAVPALNLNASIRYNNYKGFGYVSGLGASVKGVVSLGYNVSDGEGSFSAAINPAGFLSKSGEEGRTNDEKIKNRKDKAGKVEGKLKDRMISRAKREAIGALKSIANIRLLGSGYGIFTHNESPRATNIASYTGFSTNFNVSVEGVPFNVPVGVEGGVTGNYTEQNNPATSEPLSVYGYMYSSSASSDDASLMDYFVEKESTYEKRDVFLGIPFSNSDNFMVTGEGIGGGFRMHNKKIGHFRPNKKHSEINIGQLGAEVQLGTNIGVGIDIGVGEQKLDVGKWDPIGFNFSDPGTATGNGEPVFFRFNNDLGGEVDFGTTNAAVSADISSGYSSSHSALNPSGISSATEVNGGQRSGRSSYIAFHTNAEMAMVGGYRYKAYCKDEAVNTLANRTAVSNGIGEIAVFNEDGSRYVYGLPVYSKNEINMQYDVPKPSDNYIAYKNTSGSNKMQTGEERPDPYATSFLLTEITSPDYVDRTLDGPSTDDYGGYTKFSYTRVHGSYRWRMPYTGLFYSRNELSDPEDDAGLVNAGEKEVYYLDKIETKTHIAKFTLSDRKDGLEASSESQAANSSTVKGTGKLKRLDKIELFAKKEDGTEGRLIKTVRFDYDYSLMQNIPNTIGTGSETGKLTLKKVWFEYEGTANAKISPYQFRYSYPTSTEADYPSVYNSFENYGNFSASAQNPTYTDSRFLDAWGNYQLNGQARHSDMKTWLAQTNSTAFDPAAWQLKVIQLPSGGEIHVQYEQKDYSWVQDRNVMAMVSLSSTSGEHSAGINNSPVKYYLNLADIGINFNALSTVEKNNLKNFIRKHFITNNEKIYFKFLYSLVGTNASLSGCASEYVTGYLNVSEVNYNSTGLFIEVTDNGANSLPREVCLDMVKKTKGGKLGNAVNCNPSDGVIPTPNDVAAMVYSLIGMIGTTFAGQAINCLDLNSSLSYFRIPLFDSKKGGGVRVKRLLMFDQGMEDPITDGGKDSPDRVLYGSEYIYETVDPVRGIISSGVATNEPGTIREENALVTFIARHKQSWINKVIAGRDKKQSEGPLGESILPSPSIGYSKVIVKNIHSGKTNTGFTIHEFFTAKDFPVKMGTIGDPDPVAYPVAATGIKEEKYWLPIPAGVVNYMVNNLWLTQGFRFLLNNMHGQVKSITTYAGDYSNVHDLTKNILSSGQWYDYFAPGEQVPVDMFNLSYTKNLGKEVEIVTESKAIEDISDDANIEGDVSIGIATIPIIMVFGSAFPSVSYNESKMHTHATTKIVRYPSIIKSVTNFQDGIYTKTQNLAFNPATGKPILTKTVDGYDLLTLQQSANHNGSYRTYNFPASEQYPAMGQRAMNERMIISGPTINKVNAGANRFLEFSGSDVCNALAKLTPGDFVRLSTGELYHIGDISGSRVQIFSSKMCSNCTGSGAVTSIEIIHSGRTNQLSAMAGSITTYGAPQQPITMPIPSSILGPRQQFVNLLNGLLASNGGTISASQIPAGLKFIFPGNGSCSSLPADINITLENNSIILELESVISNHIKNSTFEKCTGSGSSSNLLCLPEWTPVAYSSVCVPYWDVTHGSPTYSVFSGSSNSVTLVSGQNDDPGENIGEGIRQEINDLLVGNNYEISFDYILNPSHPIEELKIVLSNDVYADCSAMVQGSNNAQTPIPGLSIAQTLMNASDNSSLDFTGNINSFNKIITCNTSANQIYIYPEGVGSTHLITSAEAEHGVIQIMNFEIRDVLPPVLCSGSLKKVGASDHFAIDPNTGQLVYYTADNSCFPQPVECLQFCPDAFPQMTLSGVLAASALSFNDDWNYDASIFNIESDLDIYERGEKGNWRQESNCTYRTSIIGGAKPSERNYTSAGVFDEFTFYNWKYPAANDPGKWLQLNTIKKYSPNGDAMEEENILGIKSAAKFGYKHTVPTLVAQNSDYASVQFESFEKQYSSNGLTFFEDGLQMTAGTTVDASTAHSGKYSLRLPSGFISYQGLKDIIVTDHLFEKGLSVKLWVKETNSTIYLPLLGGNAGFYEFEKISQTGEWGLYEVKVIDWGSLGIGDVFSSAILFSTLSSPVWMDDVRVQPLDAQVNCYVYDVNTLRLLTSFDDQHFGLFYQYNAEGKLVRKLIETERGIKTVQETQYHTPLSVVKPAVSN